jgi:UrcA family protein
MTIKKSRLTFVSAGLTLALTCATALQAATLREDGVRQTAVSYADLDLTRSADVERMYQRLQNAVKEVCAQSTGNRLRDQVRVQQCTRRSMDNAIVSINAQQLTWLHIEKTKDRRAPLLADK